MSEFIKKSSRQGVRSASQFLKHSFLTSKTFFFNFLSPHFFIPLFLHSGLIPSAFVARTCSPLCRSQPATLRRKLFRGSKFEFDYSVRCDLVNAGSASSATAWIQSLHFITFEFRRNISAEENKILPVYLFDCSSRLISHTFRPRFSFACRNSKEKIESD